MSPRDTHQLGDLIRRTREARGLSQSELARLSGVGRTTLIRIEQAEIESPDPHKLQLLARHLDLLSAVQFGHETALSRRSRWGRHGGAGA